MNGAEWQKKPHGELLHRDETESLVELFGRFVFGVHDDGVDAHNVTGALGSPDRIDEKHATQAVPSNRPIDGEPTDEGAGYGMSGELSRQLLGWVVQVYSEGAQCVKAKDSFGVLGGADKRPGDTTPHILTSLTRKVAVQFRQTAR